MKLQQMIECPNCRDTYKNPQILTCQHTVCESCVDELRSGNDVQCPTCDTCSHIDDVRRDINKEQLLQVCQSEAAAAGDNMNMAAGRQAKEQVRELIVMRLTSRRVNRSLG